MAFFRELGQYKSNVGHFGGGTRLRCYYYNNGGLGMVHVSKPLSLNLS